MTWRVRLMFAAGSAITLVCAVGWLTFLDFRARETEFDQQVRLGMPRDQVYAQVKNLGNYQVMDLGQGSCSNMHKGQYIRERVFISPFVPRLAPGTSRFICFDASDTLIEISNNFS